MDTLYTPLLALAGTLAVALIGLYQWRKKRTDDLTGSDRQRRKEALEGLWNRLEQINIQLREEHGNRELPNLQRETNVYFLQHSIWFDDKHQVLINDYISTLEKFRTAIFSSGDEDVINLYLRTSIMSTALTGELQAIETKLANLRAQIKAIVQSNGSVA